MGFVKLNNPKRINGSDTVNVVEPTSTFGEVAVSQLYPIAQGDFVYNINRQIFTTSSFSGGSVTSSDGFAVLESGTDTNGSATVQLRRGVKYRSGQGSLMRATALFDTPNAGSAQFIGLGSSECGYFIGYFGTSFGILHSETGAREIRKLTVTTGAGTGNVTVTLDGDSISVPVVGNNDVTQTAHQLSLADYSQVGSGGWLADAISGSVYFISARSGPASGAYSVSGASIVGTFSSVVTGETQTNTFVTASNFNIDKLDGLGPSGMILNPQRGNVYQIGFQYLGFGNAKFAVEDPNTGRPYYFHEYKNANSRTTPVLKNPNVNALATSANIGGTTSTTLKTASIAAFTEGRIEKLDPKFAKSFSFSGINSATYKPLALFKTNRVFEDKSCYGEFDLLKLAGSNNANNQTVTVGVFLNPRISGDVNYQYVNEQNSTVSYAQLSPSTQTITNLASINPFYELVVGSEQAVSEYLEDYQFVFGVGVEVLIAIKTTGSCTGQVSINWFEQQ
jgi:hypothetical protein